MYFVMEEDRDYAFDATFEDPNSGNDLKWLQGTPIDPSDAGGLRLIVNEAPDMYPDFFTEVPAVFCSRRMRDALESAGVDNVQYFPVTIEDSGTRVDGYYAINVVGRVSCLDSQKAQFTVWRKRISRIQSLAIDESNAKDFKLFRLHGYTELLLVSDSVTRSLDDLRGLRLTPANGWSDEHRF